MAPAAESACRVPLSHTAVTNREIAVQFVTAFCAGDLERLGSLMAETCRFTGPFHTFESRDQYLEVLRRDPARCDHRVRSVTDHGDDVAVFYDMEKADGPLTVAQLFRFGGGKIVETVVVFDGR